MMPFGEWWGALQKMKSLSRWRAKLVSLGADEADVKHLGLKQFGEYMCSRIAEEGTVASRCLQTIALSCVDVKPSPESIAHAMSWSVRFFGRIMQFMAVLLILWCGLQCAYLILDTRYALEQALEQMYMKLLTIVPFALLKWRAGSFLKDNASYVPDLAQSGFKVSTFARHPSAVMGIMTTVSGIAQWFLG